MFHPGSERFEAAGDAQQGQHGVAAAVVGFQIERNCDARRALGQAQTALGVVQRRAAAKARISSSDRRDRREGHGARANGRQQIVRIARGHDQDQVRRGLFQRLEKGVGGLLIGAVDVVDQEDAPVAFQRLERGAVFQQAHLLDGDLAQRAVGSESQEIRMRGEEERVFVALVGGPFFAVGDEFRGSIPGSGRPASILAASPTSARRNGGRAWLCRRLRVRKGAASAESARYAAISVEGVADDCGIAEEVIQDFKLASALHRRHKRFQAAR